MQITEIESYRAKKWKEYIKSFGQVYIYGAGEFAHKYMIMLKQQDVSISGFAVTDTQNNPSEIDGIHVFGIDTICKDSNDILFIVGVSKALENEVLLTMQSKFIKNVLRFVSPSEISNLSRKYPKLEITATLGCNINCKYCPQSVLYKAYFENDKNRNRILSYDDYKVCLSHMPENTIITFSGFVEPFLHPQTVEMILYAHETDHEIELYTTFMGLSKNQFDKIKHIPFRQLVLHTPDSLGYANIKITDEYKSIIDEALNMTKPDGTPYIDAANCQSIPATEFTEIAKGRIRVGGELMDRAGLLNADGLIKSDYKSGRLSCSRMYEFNQWVLLPDGSVVTCCMDFGLQNVFGNLKYDNYNTIMEGKKYKDFISSVRTNCDNDVICRKCMYAREENHNKS